MFTEGGGWEFRALAVTSKAKSQESLLLYYSVTVQNTAERPIKTNE